MEQKEALGEAYDRTAQEYDQVAGANYLKALRSLLPFANVGPLPAILDVGCGTGINLLELARVLGPCRELVGLDLSAGMLDVARRKAASAGVAATFHVGDAEALPLPDASFDLVVCNSAYHWFPDRARAMTEMARVLRPGGQLLLGSLANPAFDEWLGVVNAVWMRLFGRTCTAFPAMPTPDEVTAQLRAAGMGIESLRYHITPGPVTDARMFLSTMAVVAPVWLPEKSDADARRVRDEVLGVIDSASGFLCTYAAIEVVARKGAPIPRQARPMPPAQPLRTGKWMT